MISNTEMEMFCFQCQETSKNEACTKFKGVCGKTSLTAGLQDVLVYSLKGIAAVCNEARLDGKLDSDVGIHIAEGLFTTITNANFDDEGIADSILKSLAFRDSLKLRYRNPSLRTLPDCATWEHDGSRSFQSKFKEASIMATENEDIRSLRELLISGLKGIAAYMVHAHVLGSHDKVLNDFMVEALCSTTQDLSAEELTALVLKAGSVAVNGMALLDHANTSRFGNPEISTVNIGVGKNPGMLISGHDLKDIKELLEQTEGQGIDVYTHSEMLPAHYYPELKKFKHLVGNYGNAWWKQKEEFSDFNGPILMTTNCIVPVDDSYKNRIFTTGQVGYPGVIHIEEAEEGEQKDFSMIIKLAKLCEIPKEIETGSIVGGFAHSQVIQLADKIVEAVKSGAIKKFIVLAGCDGRHKDRNYYTSLASLLPKDNVILTAGCAKFRYNKLKLGDINGIPRVLDAGQCNDSYSLVVIALKLKEVFGLDDINDLPISYDIAWYEQKAVAVLLALLHLGVKGIRLGPTLPGFLSPNVAKLLVETFDIKPIGSVENDIQDMCGVSVSEAKEIA